MEKLPITEQDAWSLTKWVAGLLLPIIYWLAKFVFGSVVEDIKDNKTNIQKLEAKIESFESKIDNFIKEMKDESAFQKHLIRKMNVKTRAKKQREKRNERKE
jgi:hypothetical protein